MICYQPLARQLCLFLGIIIEITSTFVSIDEYVVWVKFLKEILPFGLMILVIVILFIQLLVPLELLRAKEASAIGPH